MNMLKTKPFTGSIKDTAPRQLAGSIQEGLAVMRDLFVNSR